MVRYSFKIIIRLAVVSIITDQCFGAGRSGRVTKRIWEEEEIERHDNLLREVIEHSKGGSIDLLIGPSVLNIQGNSVRRLDTEPCDPNDVILSDSVQWSKEVGYWLGDLTFLGPNGDPFTSKSWPYQYDHYKGFITSNVEGNKYRQRNIFLYPPLKATEFDTKDSKSGRRIGTKGGKTTFESIDKSTKKACASLEDNPDNIAVVGDGKCGLNGNAKVFMADQQATTCSNNSELQGDIEGPYGSLTYTYTQLVGKDNALLYQVFITKEALNYFTAVILNDPFGVCIPTENPYVFDCGFDEDRIIQSQLTTLTMGTDNVQRRTRTAQGFDAFARVGMPTSASFYREYAVTEDVFLSELQSMQEEYNIRDEDMGAWMSGETGGTVSANIGGTGIEAVMAFLNESFTFE